MFDIKPLKDQHYETLKMEYNAQNLFVDPKFPPTRATLSHTGRRFQDIHWRRATEIIPNAQFVNRSFHRGDLDQGELGNCWFLAAAGAVTLHPDLLECVVPPNQSFDKHNYAGIFHFRFWIDGQWYDVVIDDYLPCKPDGRLVFCRNNEQKNEMWGPLLEKAYAKICGSYESMEGGSPADALIDMTGGIEEIISPEKSHDGKFNDKEQIKHLILQSHQRKSMIGCAIHNQQIGRRGAWGRSEGRLSNGLLTDHAYSITAIAKVKTNSGHVTLIRCQNPWGNDIEWNGPYSDNSKTWNEVSDDQKRNLNLKKKDDGEFWMSFDDFFDNFNHLNICHRLPSGLCTNETSTWNEKIFHGKWILSATAGGCGNDDPRNFFKNPQYLIKINSTDDSHNISTVIVALTQKDTRQRRMRGLKDLSIGLSLCKINDGVDVRDTMRQGNLKFNIHQLKRIDKSGSYTNKRQVTNRFSVPPGDYVLIPSTYYPNEEGKFLLRVFTENKADGEELDRDRGNPLEPDVHEDENVRHRLNDIHNNHLNPHRHSPHGHRDKSPHPHGHRDKSPHPHGHRDKSPHPHGHRDKSPHPHGHRDKSPHPHGHHDNDVGGRYDSVHVDYDSNDPKNQPCSIM